MNSPPKIQKDYMKWFNINRLKVSENFLKEFLSLEGYKYSQKELQKLLDDDNTLAWSNLYIKHINEYINKRKNEIFELWMHS